MQPWNRVLRSCSRAMLRQFLDLDRPQHRRCDGRTIRMVLFHGQWPWQRMCRGPVPWTRQLFQVALEECAGQQLEQSAMPSRCKAASMAAGMLNEAARLKQCWEVVHNSLPGRLAKQDAGSEVAQWMIRAAGRRPSRLRRQDRRSLPRGGSGCGPMPCRWAQGARLRRAPQCACAAWEC